MIDRGTISEAVASSLVADVLPPVLPGVDIMQSVWHHAARKAGTDAVHLITSIDMAGNVWWLAAPSQALTDSRDGAALAVALPGHPAHAGWGGYILDVAGRQDGTAMMVVVTPDGPEVYSGRVETLTQMCREKELLLYPAEGDGNDEWQSFGHARERMQADLLSRIGLIGWRTAAFAIAMPLIAGVYLWGAAATDNAATAAHNQMRAAQSKQVNRLIADPYQTAMGRLDSLTAVLQQQHGVLRSFKWVQARADDVPTVEWVAVLRTARPSEATMAAFGPGANAQPGPDGVEWKVTGR